MATPNARYLVVFWIGPHRLAVPMERVQRTVRAVEITPLPGAPERVRGVINFHGEVIPVYDVRARLGLPARALQSTDHLVIVETARRTLALLIGRDLELLLTGEDEIVPVEELLPAGNGTSSVLNLGEAIVLIQDVDRFLSSEDDDAVTAALAA